MTDWITDSLIWINALEALGILIFAIVELLREKRKSFWWEWASYGITGGLWLFLYVVDILMGPRTLMGTGYIRFVVTITLGLLFALMEMHRIPRKP
jgi:hypothetical protein